MRIFLALAYCVIATSAWAQGEPPPVRWPVIALTARDAAGFVPQGWAVEGKRTGDFDGDGIADLVLIVHERASANVLHHQQIGTGDLDTNPRLLVVARGRRDGSYRLLLANRTLIPRWTEPNLDDPMGDMDAFIVRKGAFRIPLHMFANAGGWGTFERSFAFRIINGRCLLIGYDAQYLQRNSGVTTTTSVNYLISAKVVRVEEDGESVHTQTRRTTLSKRPLLTIDEVGDGMNFQPK